MEMPFDKLNTIRLILIFLMRSNKMKKTILLPIVFLISFLISGCASYVPLMILYTPKKAISAYFNSFYYKYDFVNYKNKNVIAEKTSDHFTEEYAIWYESEIIMDNVKFKFSLNEYCQEINDDEVMVYAPLFRITAPEDKYIDRVFINRVIIYSGKNEYNMLEKTNDVIIYLEAPSIDDDIGSYTLTEEEIANLINTGGLIEPTIYTNDNGALINVRGVSVYFDGIPKNIINKKVRMLFDISVEYTTGEKIQINQEVTGLQKLRRRKLEWWEYIWFPTT